MDANTIENSPLGSPKDIPEGDTRGLELELQARLARMRLSGASVAVGLLAAVAAYLGYLGYGVSALIAFCLTAAIAWMAFVKGNGPLPLPGLRLPSRQTPRATDP